MLLLQTAFSTVLVTTGRSTSRRISAHNSTQGRRKKLNDLMDFGGGSFFTTSFFIFWSQGCVGVFRVKMQGQIRALRHLHL